MAFTQMAFSPTTGLRDTATYPTQPASEADLRDSIQDQSDQLRDYLNNTLLPSLESSDAGSSGAESIGCADVGSITGTTVQAMLQSLKDAITALSLSASGLGIDVVETDHLVNLAVTAAKLAADAVETLKIKDAAVTTEKIADDAVTVDKLADNSVGANQIVDGSISQNKIAAGAVTSSKLDKKYVPVSNNVTAIPLASLEGFQFMDAKGQLYTLRTTGDTSAASLALLKDNNAATKFIEFNYAGRSMTSWGYLTFPGRWNTAHPIIGDIHLWCAVTGAGGEQRLMWKEGEPTSETDGTSIL